MKYRVWYIRLKGFTIIELLVTMTLSSIVILFMYSALNKTQQLFYSYKDQNKYISEMVLLKEILARQVEETKWIENRESGLLFKSDSTDILLRCINDKLLIESSNHRDTFDLGKCSIQKQFLNNLNGVKNDFYVNGFDVVSEYGKQKFNFTFKKEYDSSVILNELMGQ